jgi:hypothetical protein
MQPRDAGTGAASRPAPTSRLLVSSQPLGIAVQGPLSVSQTRELYVSSVHTTLTGEHRELRRFYAPSGELYYEKLLAYSTELDAPVPFLDHVSVPRSKQVAALTPDASGQLIVSDLFPVAGTWISDRAMTGTWRVELYLDGAPTPTATLPFELVP